MAPLLSCMANRCWLFWQRAQALDQSWSRFCWIGIFILADVFSAATHQLDVGRFGIVLSRGLVAANESVLSTSWVGQSICYHLHMAVGQNQWYHFGVGAQPILVYFSGDWDVHWGYDLDLTHGHMASSSLQIFPTNSSGMQWTWVTMGHAPISLFTVGNMGMSPQAFLARIHLRQGTHSHTVSLLEGTLWGVVKRNCLKTRLHIVKALVYGLTTSCLGVQIKHFEPSRVHAQLGGGGVQNSFGNPRMPFGC